MSIESITEALNEHEACESNPLNISFEECDNPQCRAAQVELAAMSEVAA